VNRNIFDQINFQWSSSLICHNVLDIGVSHHLAGNLQSQDMQDSQNHLIDLGKILTEIISEQNQVKALAVMKIKRARAVPPVR
jgi:hypothetical protein